MTGKSGSGSFQVGWFWLKVGCFGKDELLRCASNQDLALGAICRSEIVWFRVSIWVIIGLCEWWNVVVVYSVGGRCCVQCVVCLLVPQVQAPRGDVWWVSVWVC